MRERIDHETLLRHVDYDPETGVLRWKIPTSWKFAVGDVIGHDPATWGGRKSMTLGLFRQRYKFGPLSGFT